MFIDDLNRNHSKLIKYFNENVTRQEYPHVQYLIDAIDIVYQRIRGNITTVDARRDIADANGIIRDAISQLEGYVNINDKLAYQNAGFALFYPMGNEELRDMLGEQIQLVGETFELYANYANLPERTILTKKYYYLLLAMLNYVYVRIQSNESTDMLDMCITNMNLALEYTFDDLPKKSMKSKGYYKTSTDLMVDQEIKSLFKNMESEINQFVGHFAVNNIQSYFGTKDVLLELVGYSVGVYDSHDFENNIRIGNISLNEIVSNDSPSINRLESSIDSFFEKILSFNLDKKIEIEWKRINGVFENMFIEMFSLFDVNDYGDLLDEGGDDNFGQQNNLEGMNFSSLDIKRIKMIIDKRKQGELNLLIEDVNELISKISPKRVVLFPLNVYFNENEGVPQEYFVPISIDLEDHKIIERVKEKISVLVNKKKDFYVELGFSRDDFVIGYDYKFSGRGEQGGQSGIIVEINFSFFAR